MPDPKKKPIIVNSKNDSRYKAYQDSLTAYNRDIAFDKELIELVKRKGTITEKERQLLDKKYPLNNVKPKKEYGLNKAPILFTGDKGYKVKDLMVFKKPQQPVIVQDVRKPNITIGKQVKENGNRGMVLNETLVSNKPREKITPLQQLQTQSVIQNNQKITTPLPNITIPPRIPKSWNIDYSTQRMNNGIGYYDQNNVQGVDMKIALKAKEQADRVNAGYEKKYGNSTNPKAIERLNTLKDTVTITPQYAYGGQLNNNMQNNNLTRFDEGGLHHQNPLGGIPVGGNNTVEQGETKMKNYVYSNRLSIDENMTKEMNLPSYIKGKTFASASKAIDNKFKDRNDNHSLETKKVFLERLKEAQETLKQQEQQRAEQIAQSMQSNQQEVPDMMNGQIPEGMEEYTEQPEQPKQFFTGGDIVRSEIGNQTGGMSGLSGKMSPYLNLSSNKIRKFEDGGELSTQDYLGAAEGALSLSSLAQGNGASTDKFSSALGGAFTGVKAGMAFGPIGAGVGAAVGIGAGLIGSNKLNKQRVKDINTNALNINSQFQDNFAYGGDLEDPINPLFKPTNTIPQVGAGKPSDFLGYSIKPKNILPKPPTANMNTNIIQNFQDGLGMDPKTSGYGTHIGNKTALAYNNWAKTNNPDDYLKTGNPLNNFYGSKANPLESGKRFTNYMHDSRSEYTMNLKNKMGLTPQGYKYLDPETLDTSMLKLQEQPFVESVGVRQNMEDSYQKQLQSQPINKEGSVFSRTTDKVGDYLDKNGGKFLKYAPVAMNAYQLAKLKKPENQHLQRLDDKYKAQYVDEAQLQNIANQEMTNTINGISQSGASQGAIRGSILGAGLNKTKALSDAYMKANAENRATDDKAQQFNLGVNQFNTQTQHQESQNWEQNEAAYRNEKSKYLSSIGTDLGSIGKEEVNKNQIAEALGYDVDGDYVINKVTKERIHKDELAKRIAAKEKTTTNAYGGYLKMNKIGRK